MKYRAFVSALLAAGVASAASPPPEDEAVLGAVRTELERGRRIALAHADPPYYVGYWVTDRTSRTAEATLGAIVNEATQRRRLVKVDLRVGSRAFDSSNALLVSTEVGAGMGELSGAFAPRGAPMEDSSVALRRALWLATDAAYKAAAEAFERKKAAKSTERTSRPEVPSFSERRAASIVSQDPIGAEPDLAQLVRAASAVFRGYPQAHDSEVRAIATRVKRRFLDTEGALVVESANLSILEISAETQAEDGMAVSRSAFVTSTAATPIASGAASREAQRIATELDKLRVARVAEDFSGPVLFEGRAAAQIAFELLGEALSGTPPPGGQTDFETPFARRLGKRVLPRGASLVDDPTLATFGSSSLLGHYAADDEGVAAERTVLVEDGVLKTLLMSRTPREGIAESNGHGRSGLVGLARGRPGNLILKSTRGLGAKALKAKLLAAIREEQAPYGLVIRELAARSSSTGGQSPPDPEVAFRIDPDGKETLIRGAKLPPIDLRELRNVVAIGSDPAVYGFVAESDVGLDLATSVVSAALLFQDLEVRGPSGQNKRPAVVPRPVLGSAGGR